ARVSAQSLLGVSSIPTGFRCLAATRAAKYLGYPFYGITAIHFMIATADFQAVHPKPINDSDAATVATVSSRPSSCRNAIAINTIMIPGITFTNGSGHIADQANAKMTAPTRRLVISGGSVHRGRLTPSIARSAGLTVSAKRLNRVKSNGRLDRSLGKVGALRPSIISTVGNN